MFNIILTQAPPSKLGLLMGIGSLITAMAPAVGPVLGGVIVDAYGWRVIFWVRCCCFRSPSAWRRCGKVNR